MKVLLGKKSIGLLMLACSFFGLTVATKAQSRLVFPVLSADADTLTGLAVLNPNETSAVVLFTAYGANGQVVDAPGFRNYRQVTIGPGRQFADVTSNLFGNLPEGSTGWFEASSDSAFLTGFFLHLDFPDFTYFDGADLPRLATQLVFTDVRLRDGFSTQIYLVNPDSQTASVQLTLQSDEPSRSRTREIAAHGTLRIDAAELFQEASPSASESGSFPDPAIVKVFSTNPVAGFAFVRQAGGDLLGLNAVPAGELFQRLYFPQMALGEIIRTELSLNNPTDQDALLTLVAHREDGELFGPGEITTNPVDIALAAGQVLHLDLADSFGFIGSQVREGWLEVLSTTSAVQGALSYSLPANGSLAAVAASRQGSRQAAFSHLATTAGFFTGLAILNPASLAADVRIVAISSAGEILGTATRTLAPGERISQLVGVELIPQAAEQSGGALYVRSSLPIYLTSLFGRLEGSGVLANIPAQPVPRSYQPDRDLPQARVEPPLAAVEPGGSLSFMLQMGSGETTSWKVNGIPGGNALLGTVGAGGIYQAPANSPMRLPVSITAEAGDQSASASVDVVSREVLVGGLGLVQSVAFLEGLSRLFVAELGVAAESTLETTAPQGFGSLIRDVTSEQPLEIRQFPGEDISKIVGYREPGGRESLLLAGRASGNIYLLRVEEPIELRTIASGLNAPGAMALDPATGDLIVAEADKLSRVSAAQLLGAGQAPQGNPPAGSLLLEGVSPRGITVDQCTGDVFFSEATDGSIQRLDRDNLETGMVVMLSDPTQLLGIFRSGVPCPDAFHLLVAEPTVDRVTRVVPESGAASQYAEVAEVQDLTLLPGGEMSGSGGVLATEQAGGQGQVERLIVPDTYQPDAYDSPDLVPCVARVELADPNLEAAVRDELEIGPTEPITCQLARDLTVLFATGLGISRLDGIEAFSNLQALIADNNQISDLTPLSKLEKLSSLELSFNQISDITPLSNLSDLRMLRIRDNQISDLSPISDLLSLNEVWVSENLISDIGPLAGLGNLRSLHLSSNQIVDITPLAGLVKLYDLSLFANQISDISPLAGLVNLRSLRLFLNEINDLGALANLQELQLLYTDRNQIVDLTPLAGLVALTNLDVSSNQVTDVSPLVGLINIKVLSLYANQISNVSSLLPNQGLGAGDFLYLIYNPLDAGDCPDLATLAARGVEVDIFADLCP